MEKKRITFSMPMKLYLLLFDEAKKNGVPVTGMINICVKQSIKQALDTEKKLFERYEHFGTERSDVLD